MQYPCGKCGVLITPAIIGGFRVYRCENYSCPNGSETMRQTCSEKCRDESMAIAHQGYSTKGYAPIPTTIGDVFACTSTEEFKNMLDKLIEEKMNA